MKASANYEKIAAGLSRAVVEITEVVAICVKQCFLYPTKALVQGTASLYAHIFHFLRDAIKWYTKRSSTRLLSSFKEDFYESFEEQISNIKDVSASINREAQHASNSEVRYLRLCSESWGIGLKGLEMEAAERRHRDLKAAEERARESEIERKLIPD